MLKQKINTKLFFEGSLIGMTKEQIVELIGIAENSYLSDVWYYIADKTWYQLKRVVFIYFEDNIVEIKFVKYIYGKVKITKL